MFERLVKDVWASIEKLGTLDRDAILDFVDRAFNEESLTPGQRARREAATSKTLALELATELFMRLEAEEEVDPAAAVFHRFVERSGDRGETGLLGEMAVRHILKLTLRTIRHPDRASPRPTKAAKTAKTARTARARARTARARARTATTTVCTAPPSPATRSSR